MALSFDAFISRYYPHLEEQYNIKYQLDTDPNSLIGVEVTSTRSGFSCGSGGGTNMIIEDVSSRFIHFKANEKFHKFDYPTRWSCDHDELPFCVKLTNPEEMSIKWLRIKNKE